MSEAASGRLHGLLQALLGNFKGISVGRSDDLNHFEVCLRYLIPRLSGCIHVCMRICTDLVISSHVPTQINMSASSAKGGGMA